MQTKLISSSNISSLSHSGSIKKNSAVLLPLPNCILPITYVIRKE